MGRGMRVALFFVLVLLSFNLVYGITDDFTQLVVAMNADKGSGQLENFYGRGTDGGSSNNDWANFCDVRVFEMDAGVDERCTYKVAPEIIIENENGFKLFDFFEYENINDAGSCIGNGGIFNGQGDYVRETLKTANKVFGSGYTHQVQNSIELNDLGGSTYRPKHELVCYQDNSVLKWAVCNQDKEEKITPSGVKFICNENLIEGGVDKKWQWVKHENDCADSIDNDGDADVDCEDSDCIGKDGPGGNICGVPEGFVIKGEYDPNFNYAENSADESKINIVESFEQCFDNIDNDQDGLFDYWDEDCLKYRCSGIKSGKYISELVSPETIYQDGSYFSVVGLEDGCCGDDIDSSYYCRINTWSECEVLSTESDCSANINCNWAEITRTCAVKMPCISEYNDETSCDADSDCYWYPGTNPGGWFNFGEGCYEVESCSSKDTESSCNLKSGCEWVENTINLFGEGSDNGLIGTTDEKGSYYFCNDDLSIMKKEDVWKGNLNLNTVDLVNNDAKTTYLWEATELPWVIHKITIE